ncbi:MAG: TetR/AcrR family transcriptional regulator [Acidobacteriota bacterium]
MENRQQKKISRKREEILRSAASAFKRKGYHGTSMGDISDALLMTKGSLYYYFKNKEQILFACHDFSLNKVLENLKSIEESRTPPPEKLRDLIATHITVMIDELQASAMALEFDALSPPLLNKVIEKRDQYEKGFRNVIEEGIKKGFFIECDSKLITFAIMGAINWITKWFHSGRGYSAGEVGDAFAEYFVRGLSAKPRRTMFTMQESDNNFSGG